MEVESPLYLAPELCEDKEYDERVDVWSLGVIIFTLLSGQPPFGGESKEEIQWNIVNAELVFDPDAWERVSSNATDFCLKCLNRNWQERPRVEQLFEHAWIKEWVDDPVIKRESGLKIASNLLS